MLAAIATAVELLRRDRLDRLSGRLAPHSGVLKPDWVVKLDGEYVGGRHRRGSGFDPDRHRDVGGGGPPTTVASGWRPGESGLAWDRRGPQDFGAGAAAAQWRPPCLEGHVGDGARHAAEDRRARAADAGQGGAGHIEAAALPDAGAGRIASSSPSARR